MESGTGLTYDDVSEITDTWKASQEAKRKAAELHLLNDMTRSIY